MDGLELFDCNNKKHRGGEREGTGPITPAETLPDRRVCVYKHRLKQPTSVRSQVMKVHAVIMGSLSEYENQKIEEWGRDVEASSQVHTPRPTNQSITHMKIESTHTAHRQTPIPL